jgi:CheY-like chemotaxis protein
LQQTGKNRQRLFVVVVYHHIFTRTFLARNLQHKMATWLKPQTEMFMATQRSFLVKEEVRMDLGKKYTVVVIDDDPSVLKALGRLLASSGYEVITYPSAVELIEVNQYDNIDCLVLDVRMPDVSGLILQDILRALGHQIPIVFITAHSTEWIEKTALERGAAAYLRKPIGDQLLIDSVESAIQVSV